MAQNGTRVSAYNTKSFVFLPEKSVGDPSVDKITTVNIPAWVSHELQIPGSQRKKEYPSGAKESSEEFAPVAPHLVLPPPQFTLAKVGLGG